jgi:arabinofuranan 3-O-arabinosyltransferase
MTSTETTGIKRRVTGPTKPDRASEGSPGRVDQRPWLIAGSAVLTAAMFLQRPGYTSPDTKLDLTQDPVQFLARSLHLWEPTGFLGQVQNQAYGYLLPMGPFFSLGHLLQVPGWVVQRLWWSILLSLAFVGLVKLATVLRIGTPATRLVAGMAFAVSPRMLMTLGAVSIEVLPMALAPWVLIPLVKGSIGGDVRRAAARSGVAVLLTGGVNAVASAATLPAAALFLATRSRGRRRARLTLWWGFAVVLATLWWVLPLLLLGRYSPPFLGWIENANVTTRITSLGEVLRGTSHWLAFLGGPAGPDWPGGWSLATEPALVLDTALVAGLGLLGLALPGLRERRWLAVTVFVGFGLVTMGHLGPIQGGLAEQLHTLLDSYLAPLRNVHKFDVVLRVPLALGVAHALAWIASLAHRRFADGSPWLPRPARGMLVGLLVVTLAGAAAPLYTGQIVARGSYQQIPSYWFDAARWLDARADHGRTLIAPGASFAEFAWGSTQDEPLQAIGGSGWVVRDAVPLTPAGTIRMLDAVQRRFVSGEGSPGLAAYLSRAGIGFVLVSNDLDRTLTSSPRPVLVRQALVDSGLQVVASFGPMLGTENSGPIMTDQGLAVPVPSLEIFAVPGVQPTASAVPLSSALAVSGGPESLLDLSDHGLPAERPSVLAADGAPSDLPSVVTDGMRRREIAMGQVDNNSSFTLSASDPLRLNAPQRDYLPFRGQETVATVEGVRSIIASSSAGDAGTIFGTDPAAQPYAAFDGDPTTAWRSSGNSGAVGQWIEVRFDQPVLVDGTGITVAQDDVGTTPERISVTTDSGTRQYAVVPGLRLVINAPTAPTRFLRVSLTAVASGGTGRAFVVPSIDVPGVTVSRPLVTPGSGDGAVLTTADNARSGCVVTTSGLRCAPALPRIGEESTALDRVVDLGAVGLFSVSGEVVPRPGPALDALISGPDPQVTVDASSSAVPDPEASPDTVMDGSLSTGWIASPSDRRPALTIRMARQTSVAGLRVVTSPDLPASVPRAVTVESDAGQRTGTLDPDGELTFSQPLSARVLTIRFPAVAERSSVDPVTGSWTSLPVGVSELSLLGATDLRVDRSDRAVVIPCGEGPTISVDGKAVETSLTTTTSDIRLGRPAALRPCTSRAVALAGRVRVVLSANSTWRPRSVELLPVADPGLVTEPATSVTTRIRDWGTARRSLWVAARQVPTLLVVRENANVGWQASANGRPLKELTVDGWQQGYVIPAGAATAVQLVYSPDRWYRLGLVAGLVAALLLVVLAVVRGRLDSEPRLPPGVVPGWVAVSVTALFGWLLAGPVGAAVLSVAALAAVLLPRRSHGAAWAALSGLAVAGAAVLLALAPWGGPGYAGDRALPQLLVLVALAGVAAAAVGSNRPRHGRRAATRPRSEADA